MKNRVCVEFYDMPVDEVVADCGFSVSLMSLLKKLEQADQMEKLWINGVIFKS